MFPNLSDENCILRALNFKFSWESMLLNPPSEVNWCVDHSVHVKSWIHSWLWSACGFFPVKSILYNSYILSSLQCHLSCQSCPPQEWYCWGPQGQWWYSNNRLISIYYNSVTNNRPQNNALGNKPHKFCIYSPEPLTEVYCLRLNFYISKLVNCLLFVGLSTQQV